MLRVACCAQAVWPGVVVHASRMDEAGEELSLPKVTSADRVVEAVLRDAVFEWDGEPHVAHGMPPRTLPRTLSPCQEPCHPATRRLVVGEEANQYWSAIHRTTQLVGLEDLNIRRIVRDEDETKCILTVRFLASRAYRVSLILLSYPATLAVHDQPDYGMLGRFT